MVALNDITGGVRRAVVHNNYLQRHAGLTQDTVEQPANGGLSVLCRDNNADIRCHGWGRHCLRPFAGLSR